MEGVSRFIHETSRRLVNLAPDYEFHFLFDRPYDEYFVYANNVCPAILQPPARHPILWYLWFEYSVNTYLEKHNIDVFYSGDMFLSLRSKVPVLYVSHDLNYLHFPDGLKFSHQKYFEYFFPKYHRKANHIIAVSEFTKSDIVKQYGIDPSKISVAYNSVPDGFRHFENSEIEETRKRISRSKAYFLFVGSLLPRKNLARLLLAFDLFKKRTGSNKLLIIYGRKAFKTGDIESTWKSMQFKSEVIFMDNKQYSVQEIMPAAHALVYPSLFEGFGIPVLEAMKSGIPFISSDVSSIPEVAGNCGFLTDPYNVEDIAQAMVKSLDKDLVKKSKSDYDNRLSKFSWDKSASIILQKLQDISKSD